MKQRFTLACVQHCAADDPQTNLARLEAFIEKGCHAGADLVCLPETCAAMYPNTAITLQMAEREEDSIALKRLRDIAKRNNIWLAIGSIMLRAPEANSSGMRSSDEEKLVNRSFMISPQGEIVARYDKIHLFDVDLASGEHYRESDYVQGGKVAVNVSLPLAKFGLSICYDLRFPHLYRHLALQGAECLLVPAAFTQTTGEAHWHSLLRARAIETGCYVIAAAQCGRRSWGRATYGHSLIVDPWGKIVADAGEEEGIITAAIDLNAVAEARASIPSLASELFKVSF